MENDCHKKISYNGKGISQTGLLSDRRPVWEIPFFAFKLPLDSNNKNSLPDTEQCVLYCPPPMTIYGMNPFFCQPFDNIRFRKTVHIRQFRDGNCLTVLSAQYFNRDGAMIFPNGVATAWINYTLKGRFGYHITDRFL